MDAQLRDKDILARIQKLEMENTWLKRSIGAVLILVSVVLLTAQTRQSETAWQKRVLRVGTVQANALELIDVEGNSPRLSITGNGQGMVVALPSGLSMFDGSGKKLASLETLGTLRLGDTVYLTGMLGAARLELTSENARLHVGKDTSYHTEIGATELVTVGTGPNRQTSAASIVLFDDKGHVTWSADQGAELTMAVNFLNTQIQNLQFRIANADDWKRELGNFKHAACPVLQTVRVDWTTRMRLNSECGSH